MASSSKTCASAAAAKDCFQNPSYNLVTLSDAKECEAIYDEVSTTRVQKFNTSDSENTATNSSISNKKFCVLVTLVTLMVAASVCFAFLFLEVAKLKSNSAAVQAGLPSMETNSTTLTIMQYLQELNHNLSSLDERVTTEIDDAKRKSMAALDEAFVSQARLNESLMLYQVLIEESFANQTVLNESVNEPYQVTEELINTQTLITSCAALPPSFPTGYYWVRASNDSAVRVYCDMTRSCGGITGGWMRVAELDTTSNGHQCPSGLTRRTDGAIFTCVRNSCIAGCSSVEFEFLTKTVSYSKVCGRITGYQYGSTEEFNLAYQNINSTYVDGISLTHGNPRQHIWTLLYSWWRYMSSENTHFCILSCNVCSFPS